MSAHVLLNILNELGKIDKMQGLCLCCVVTVKSFPVLAFNVVIITIVRIYT